MTDFDEFRRFFRRLGVETHGEKLWDGVSDRHEQWVSLNVAGAWFRFDRTGAFCGVQNDETGEFDKRLPAKAEMALDLDVRPETMGTLTQELSGTADEDVLAGDLVVRNALGVFEIAAPGAPPPIFRVESEVGDSDPCTVRVREIPIHYPMSPCEGSQEAGSLTSIGVVTCPECLEYITKAKGPR